MMSVIGVPFSHAVGKVLIARTTMVRNCKLELPQECVITSEYYRVDSRRQSQAIDLNIIKFKACSQLRQSALF